MPRAKEGGVKPSTGRKVYAHTHGTTAEPYLKAGDLVSSSSGAVRQLPALVCHENRAGGHEIIKEYDICHSAVTPIWV